MQDGDGGGERHDGEHLDAGGFSSWLVAAEAAISDGATTDVPCGDCSACCRSSQFVHVGPDETDTLAHIPRQLLFPAPGLPRGHMVMGYDERGHCPMLVDDRCSIYDHRPRTCRAFDCRVFTATGVEPDDDKVLIADRIRRWRFSFEDDDAVVKAQALRASARAVEANRTGMPDAARPHTALQVAVTAIELHRLATQAGARAHTGGVATEIERKWMVLTPPAPELLGRGERVRQGYLAQDGDVEVRVRITDARASVTVKGGRGMTRTEVDAAISADEAEALWPLTEGRRIEKVRHRVTVDGGVAEVDVYEGALAGLHTVEVEFPSVEQASAFVVPDWFGPEVTGDAAWSNASLAVHGAPDRPPAGDTA